MLSHELKRSVICSPKVYCILEEEYDFDGNDVALISDIFCEEDLFYMFDDDGNMTTVVL